MKKNVAYLNQEFIKRDPSATPNEYSSNGSLRAKQTNKNKEAASNSTI